MLFWILRFEYYARTGVQGLHKSLMVLVGIPAHRDFSLLRILLNGVLGSARSPGESDVESWSSESQFCAWLWSYGSGSVNLKAPAASSGWDANLLSLVPRARLYLYSSISKASYSCFFENRNSYIMPTRDYWLPRYASSWARGGLLSRAQWTAF